MDYPGDGDAIAKQQVALVAAIASLEINPMESQDLGCLPELKRLRDEVIKVLSSSEVDDYQTKLTVQTQLVSLQHR